MDWVVIIIVLALLQFIGFGAIVGWARAKHQVAAPATTGPAEFERIFRVHMNTLEQLVVFVPAIWLFAQLVSPRWAFILGAVYLGGRFIYFFSYVRNPKSRSLGFALTSLPFMIMLAGVLVVVIARLAGHPLT